MEQLIKINVDSLTAFEGATNSVVMWIFTISNPLSHDR